MTDTPEIAGNGAAPQQAPVKMNVLAQFVSDMSFENILAQKGVQGDVEPESQLQVNLDAKKRTAENQYEVILKVQVTSKAKECGSTLFVLELNYVGVFHVENVPDEQLHPFLLIECPRMLFPFVRRIVSDVTHDGGLPPLNLETIDFLQLYRAELTRRASAKSSEMADA